MLLQCVAMGRHELSRSVAALLTGILSGYSSESQWLKFANELDEEPQGCGDLPAARIVDVEARTQWRPIVQDGAKHTLVEIVPNHGISDIEQSGSLPHCSQADLAVIDDQ